MWIQSLVSCPTHENTPPLFHQERYQQQETSPSFISEAPTHLSKGFSTRCGNLSESVLKDLLIIMAKEVNPLRAACSKQQPSGVYSSSSCLVWQCIRRACRKLCVAWAWNSYREELLFQMSCYIIKQERKEGGDRASCLFGTLHSAHPASILHQIPTARPIHSSWVAEPLTVISC